MKYPKELIDALNKGGLDGGETLREGMYFTPDPPEEPGWYWAIARDAPHNPFRVWAHQDLPGIPIDTYFHPEEGYRTASRILWGDSLESPEVEYE